VSIATQDQYFAVLLCDIEHGGRGLILYYGDRAKLAGKSWFLLELSSDKTVQSIMKRVGKAIPSIFRDQAVEIFLPVFERDLDEFEMKTGNYIFARATGLTQLLRLKTVTGVVGLVTEGECNRPSKALQVEDAYVQSIVEEAKKAFDNRILGIKVGSFVRILDGETRDYCGKVTVIHDGKAAIQVELKTKLIIIETPLRNLINLPFVPPEQQVFYYGPVVKQMVEEASSTLIEEDLEYKDETPAEFELPPYTDDVNHHTRQKTITALAKRLVSEGITEPLPLASRVIAAIKAREVKAPKNLFIVYCVLKSSLMDNHFSKVDPAIKNYRDVIHKFGKNYKFSANDIADIDPNLGIPVTTVGVCSDGRSREARLKKQQLLSQQQESVPVMDPPSIKQDCWVGAA
jgi:hypothetical protein